MIKITLALCAIWLLTGCSMNKSSAESEFMDQMRHEYRTTYHWLAPMVDVVSTDAEEFYKKNLKWPIDENELYPNGYVTLKLVSPDMIERISVNEFEFKRVYVTSTGAQYKLTCRHIKDKPFFVGIPE